MQLLEIVFVGLFYLPIMILPFGLLFWYAYAAKRDDEPNEPNELDFNANTDRPLTPMT